jgi:bifunctional DNA-binding transcriptional regulator/antitoxin component of YhaV-PrlF toxin-antitoxin module
MSYIVYRDVYGMEQNDPLIELIDKLDDKIIEKYQQGYVDDEFGQGMNLQEAEEYVKSKGYNCYPFPEPNGYDTLLILVQMIKNGEVDFDGIVQA